MNNFKEILTAKRTKLSPSSINTYNSTLTNLHKHIFGNAELDIKNFDDVDKILDFLKNKEPSKRKSVLSSLVVINDNKRYRDAMLEDIKSHNEFIAKQTKTKAQQEAWITQDEINEKYKDLKFKWEALLKKDKSNLTLKDIHDMQDFVILSLLGGIFIPPRRLKDFVDFRIKETTEDPATINIKNKNNLIFNSYKTSKYYGQQIVKIPSKLNRILKKWFNINPTKYLFIDYSNNPFTNVKLNQQLNKILGKNLSVNALRHAYLTYKYPGRIDDNQELKDDFALMGSSIRQEKVYIKHT